MTSHCGHSFCSPCYAQLVRHANACALCREPLGATPPGINVALRGVAQSAFPSEFEQRVEEGRQEEDELEAARARSQRQQQNGANGVADDDDDQSNNIVTGVFCMSLSSLLCSQPDRPADDVPIELN
jgi:hypothetical protein